jgi:8-oxo-dGTP pyrophosphatase MutT (NUDIX family)
MSGTADEVVREVEARTERILAGLREERDPDRTIDPIDYGPLPWHPDEVPGSVDEVLDVFAGMSSVIVFWTPAHVETVLVFNPNGHWEPPGGAVEGRDGHAETAVREATEETGLTVELTGLHSTGRVSLAYADGTTVELPVATFVGKRVEGSLRVEREVNDHPGVTRGVGLFGADVLPENCRDRSDLLDLLASHGD